MTTARARSIALARCCCRGWRCYYAATRVTIDADYSAFLPAGASDTQRAFMRELREGVASRVVLIELAARRRGRSPRRAASSRARWPRPAFRYVNNGGSALGSASSR